MASNNHFEGDNDATINLDRVSGLYYIFVSAGTTFQISFDEGSGYLTLPAGTLHTLEIAPTDDIRIRADSEWQLLAVQT